MVEGSSGSLPGMASEGAQHEVGEARQEHAIQNGGTAHADNGLDGGSAAENEMSTVQNRRSSGLSSLLPLPDRKPPTQSHVSPSGMAAPTSPAPTGTAPVSPANTYTESGSMVHKENAARGKRSSVVADFWGFTRHVSGRGSTVSSLPLSQEEGYAGSHHGSRHSSIADMDQHGGTGQDMRFRCWNWASNTHGFGSVVCSAAQRWAAVLSKSDEGVTLRSLHTDEERTQYVLEGGSLRTDQEVNRATDSVFNCTAMELGPDDCSLALASSGPNLPNGRNGPSLLTVLTIRDPEAPDSLSPKVQWSSGAIAESTMSQVRKMWWGADKEGAGEELLACCNKSSITLWRRSPGGEFCADKARDIAEDMLERKSSKKSFFVLGNAILSASGSASRHVLALAIGEIGSARKESIVRLLSMDSTRPGFYPYVREHKTTVQAVWMSEDGSKMALGGGDRRVTVLDLSLSEGFGNSSAFGDVLFEFDCDHTVVSLWGPADCSFLVAGAGHEVCMWSLFNGIKVHAFELGSHVKHCSGSRDGSLLAACSAREVQARNFGSRDIEATSISFSDASRAADQPLVEACPSLFCGLLFRGDTDLAALRAMAPAGFKAMHGSAEALAVAIADAHDEIVVSLMQEASSAAGTAPEKAAGGGRRASTSNHRASLSNRRGSVSSRRGSVAGEGGSSEVVFRCAAGLDVQAVWLSLEGQVLVAGGVDSLAVWDTEAEGARPKAVIDCLGHVVHAVWGTEDGTYLVYLVTDKRNDLLQSMHAGHDSMGMDIEDKQAGDNVIHAKLHVYHTGFEATWGSTIPVEDVELVDEQGSGGTEGGSRALNWQGFVCIDDRLMTVREKANKVSVRNLDSYTLTPRYEFEHLEHKVAGLAMWGPSEKKLLALIHPTEVRVIALETEAVLHVFRMTDVWAVWSCRDGTSLRVCSAEGVTEWSLERLFEVGPSYKRFKEFARDRQLPDPQLHSRICTDLSLFHDRQGFLARDGSFLNLLLGKGFHEAMSRFLVVHPAAVQSPCQELDAVFGSRSVLEAALDAKHEERPELSLDILLKAVLVSMEDAKLSLGCMEVVSKFVEKALEKERPEKVERAVFEFLASMKLVDLELEHLPHCSERKSRLHQQVSPYKTVEEARHGVLFRLFSPLVALLGASKILEEKENATIWDTVEDDVYSHESQACIVPIPLPEGRFIQRNLITNPISFQSDVVACVVEALWNEKFKALFRWQAFVYLVLTVCYTTFCLTCATSDTRFMDQIRNEGDKTMVAGFILGAVSVFLSALFLVYESLQITFKYQTLIHKARDERSYSASEQLPLKVVTLFTTLKEHYGSLWNVLASTCFILVPSSFTVYIVHADNVTIRATSSIGVVSIWLYTLYFARGWDEWAKLVSMLVEILRDMLPFLLVMAILVITHASGFVVVHSGTRAASEFEAMNSAVQMTLVMGFLGSWEPDELVSARSDVLTYISYAFFYALEFTILIVSLNALIGIMGQTQGRVLDMADTMIQRQRVSIILDIMDIEDHISKSSIWLWCCRPRRVRDDAKTPQKPFRERKWVHILQPKSAPKDEDHDARQSTPTALEKTDFSKDQDLSLSLPPPGDNAAVALTADGQAQLMEFAEKIPNIEMLLSKVLQGTERLTPIMNISQKSWVLTSQLDAAHAMHDKRTMDLLKDLAEKATLEKNALQAELRARSEEAEALRSEKAALQATEQQLRERVAALEKEGAATQQKLQDTQGELAVASSQLQQYQQLYQQQQQEYQRRLEEEAKQKAEARPRAGEGGEGEEGSAAGEAEGGKAQEGGGTGGEEASSQEGGERSGVREGGGGGGESEGRGAEGAQSQEGAAAEEEEEGGRGKDAAAQEEGGAQSGGAGGGGEGEGSNPEEGEGGDAKEEAPKGIDGSEGGGSEGAARREGGGEGGAGQAAASLTGDRTEEESSAGQAQPAPPSPVLLLPAPVKDSPGAVQVGGPGPMPLPLPDGRVTTVLYERSHPPPLVMPPPMMGGGGTTAAAAGSVWREGENMKLEEIRKETSTIAAQMRSVLQYLQALEPRQDLSLSRERSLSPEPSWEAGPARNLNAQPLGPARTTSLPAARIASLASSQQGSFASMTSRSRESHTERDRRRVQELVDKSPYSKPPARIQRTGSQGSSWSNLSSSGGRPRTMGAGNPNSPVPLRHSASDLGGFGAPPSTSVDHRPAAASIQVPLAGSLPARTASLSSRRLQVEPAFRVDFASDEAAPGLARVPSGALVAGSNRSGSSAGAGFRSAGNEP